MLIYPHFNALYHHMIYDAIYHLRYHHIWYNSTLSYTKHLYSAYNSSVGLIIGVDSWLLIRITLLLSGSLALKALLIGVNFKKRHINV